MAHGDGAPMRIALLAVLVCAGHMCAADCSCTGKGDAEQHGGNSVPLRWQSIERLLDPGSSYNPPWYCFEHRVFNDSASEVTDIFWKIARFERDSIPKHEDRCAVYMSQGDLQKPLPSGRMYYSVGVRYYDTTVYAPQGSGESSKSARITMPKGTPELISVIEVSNRRSGLTSSIRFASSVRTESKVGTFEYGLSTSGTEKLLVYWYVPLTADFKALAMNSTSTITAIPGETVRRTVRSPDAVGWMPATVQIFDYDRHWLATGVASAYCSLQGKEQPFLPQPNPRQ
jgi:hypothetical protein